LKIGVKHGLCNMIIWSICTWGICNIYVLATMIIPCPQKIIYKSEYSMHCQWCNVSVPMVAATTDQAKYYMHV